MGIHPVVKTAVHAMVKVLAEELAKQGTRAVMVARSHTVLQRRLVPRARGHVYNHVAGSVRGGLRRGGEADETGVTLGFRPSRRNKR